VKENKRDPLAEDEIDDGSQKTVADSLMGEKVHLPQKQQEEPNAKSKAGGRNNAKGKAIFSKVKQSKIVRTADRLDPMTGKGRSKGYGFLETGKHSDALKVLRWANNNPDVYGLLKTLWLEEMKDLAGILEKKAKKDEEEVGRLKRLKAALNGGEGEGEAKGRKRTLVVEFSIENVMIVKKREGRDAPASVCGLSSKGQWTHRKTSRLNLVLTSVRHRRPRTTSPALLKEKQEKTESRRNEPYLTMQMLGLRNE
jgi:nucleolar protein 4